MRALAALLIGAALASCSTAPEPVQLSPQAQHELATLLAGKVAGPPMSCLQNYSAYDMRIIDDRTVTFRSGASAVYLMQLSPGCNSLSSGHYALLARQSGGMGYCSGDIVRVFDTTNHFTLGSCGIERIIPYRNSASRY